MVGNGLFHVGRVWDMLIGVDFDPVEIEAISKLISAVAWPMAVSVIVLIFRRSIRDVLGRMRTFEGPGGLSVTTDAQSVATAALARADRRHAFAMRRYVAEMADLIVKLGRTPRMLWVDDRPSNNHYERSALEALGVWIELSTNTEDAHRQLKSVRYDVVVSDMRRPGDDRAGFNLLRRMRDEGDSTPYVIYSGKFASRGRNFDAAVAAGALGCSNMAGGLVRLLVRALRDDIERARSAN